MKLKPSDLGAADYRERMLRRFGAAPGDDQLEDDDEDGADECEHGVSLSDDCEDCEELEDEDDDELDDEE